MKNNDLSVEKAAELGGVKEGAIRAGITRLAIAAYKDSDGVVWVKLYPYYHNLVNKLAKAEKTVKKLSVTVPELKRMIDNV